MFQKPRTLISLCGSGISLAALLAGPAWSLQGEVKLPTKVTLRNKATQGEKRTTKTKIHATATMGLPDGTIQTFNMTGSEMFENTCIEVKNGQITWQKKNLEITASGNGPFEGIAKATVEKEQGRTSSRTEDERNRVIKSDKPDDLPFVFPEEPIEIGTSWTAQGKLFDQPVTVTYKVSRFAMFEDKVAVVIQTSFAADSTVQTPVPAETYHDVANGATLKMTGEFAFEPAPGVKVRMKVSGERQK
jgi:hypothetical protein